MVRRKGVLVRVLDGFVIFFCNMFVVFSLFYLLLIFRRDDVFGFDFGFSLLKIVGNSS